MSMLLPVARVPSFSQPNNIPLVKDGEVWHLQSHGVANCHTWLRGWTIANECFTSCEQGCSEQGVQSSLLHPDFSSFVCIPTSGTAEKSSSSIFNFWRKLHTLLFVSGSALAIAANPWVFISVLLPLRHTRSKRQVWPWSIEWSSTKANPTTQEKALHMDTTRWSTPKSDWLHSLQPKMEKLYTVNKNKTGSWLWLRSWTPYCQIQT